MYVIYQEFSRKFLIHWDSGMGFYGHYDRTLHFQCPFEISRLIHGTLPVPVPIQIPVHLHPDMTVIPFKSEGVKVAA